MATEKEDLDQLVHTQGWMRFAQHLEREWADRFQQLVRSAISDPNDTTALRKLQQVVVAKEAIEAAVKWPASRIAEIERAEPGRKIAEKEFQNQYPMSRRGSL
jgi:hypothetical protein